MRTLNLLMGCCFVASAGLQLNDPDPLAWVALYLLAALGCLGWRLGRLPRWGLSGLAGLGLLWALWILARLEQPSDLLAALTHWQMRAPGSEEIREIGGLLLVSVWLGVLALRPDLSAAPTRPGA